MISDGLGAPLTSSEKLACRVLLPIAGKRLLVQFCKWAETGNPMYRRGNMEQTLKAIEQAARSAAAKPAPPVRES